jgi:hypothetical protein
VVIPYKCRFAAERTFDSKAGLRMIVVAVLNGFSRTYRVSVKCVIDVEQPCLVQPVDSP